MLLLELLLDPPAPPLLEPPLLEVPPALPPVLEVPPVLPPRLVPVPVPVPPVDVEPPLLEELELVLLEPAWDEEDPPTALLLELLDSLLPPVTDWDELELELELDPPLPPLGLLELEDDELELSALREGGAKAQPRALVARRARMSGEKNFMRVLLRC